jgi:hypothetical protein
MIQHTYLNVKSAKCFEFNFVCVVILGSWIGLVLQIHNLEDQLDVHVS